jgi:hypothetical protein
MSKMPTNRHSGENRNPEILKVSKHWTPVFTGVTTFYEVFKIHGRRNQVRNGLGLSGRRRYSTRPLHRHAQDGHQGIAERAVDFQIPVLTDTPLMGGRQ